MSAVDKFLREKRSQQGESMQLGSSIAPSGRYGEGGYGMGIGMYTGKGPDNKTQPMNPTQRRIDANGNSYMVDENEVVVIDSQTLNAYGGPEAFQQFVQQNKPGQQGPQPSNGQQFACGGVPTRRYYGGGIPTKQYYGGGDSTRNRGIMSPEQTEMLKEIEVGMKQYQEGGIPTLNKTEKTPSAPTAGQPGITPAASVKSTRSRSSAVPTGQQLWEDLQGGQSQYNPAYSDVALPNGRTYGQMFQDTVSQTDTRPGGSHTTYDSNGTPNTTYTGEWRPHSPTPTPTPTPAKPTPTPSPTYSASNLDEMIWNRYAGRLGAQQEAQRAGEAQRGLQAGMSEQEIAGREAVGDIGRREAMAGATSEFATGAAERAQARDQFNQQQNKQQQQIDFAKQQYGDLEGQRIANDINSGMNFEQIKAKYPNVTLGAFDSMSQASNWGQTQYNRQIDTINNLVSQGGAQNLETASNLFAQQFGETIDFSRALTAENSADFNAAWNNMTGLVADGKDWEDALAVMKADGSLEKLHMDEDDVQRMYERQQLQSNPLYQAAKTVDDWIASEQAAGRAVDPKMAENLRSFMAYQFANPGGVVFETGIQVKDEFGNEVGFFTDSKKAEEFLAANPDKKYTSAQINNHVKITDTAVGAGASTTKNDGDSWTEGDTTYVQIAGERKDWTRLSASDQWGFFESTIPSGEEDNWNYSKWINNDKPITFDTFSTVDKNNVNKLVATEIENIKEDGWGKEISVGDKNVKEKLEKARENFLDGNADFYNFSDMETVWSSDVVSEKLSPGTVFMTDKLGVGPMLVEALDTTTNSDYYIVTCTILGSLGNYKLKIKKQKQ